jgi:hypothetical protein
MKKQNNISKEDFKEDVKSDKGLNNPLRNILKKGASNKKKSKIN